MEKSWDSIDEAGDYSTDETRNIPSYSCQKITEHKGAEGGEEVLTDKTYKKNMVEFKVKNEDDSSPFSDIHSHSKIMAQDLQRGATEVIQDKCSPFLERLCPVGLTNVQESCILASGFDVKKKTNRDSAAVGIGTIVSFSPFSSNLSKNIKGTVTQSPIDLELQQSSLSDSSLSDPGQYSRAVVDVKAYADVSHQMLTLLETKKGKEKISLLPVMEKQQKRKVGQPYKKTLVKMAKLSAIAQKWDSDATEISRVTRNKDNLTPSCKQTDEKKWDEMLEFPPTTSSATSFGSNSTSDSSNHLTISHSDDISKSQVTGQSISMEFIQPPRGQRTSKTTQKAEEEVPALKLTTAAEGKDSPIVQALAQNTLVLSETVCSFDDNTEDALKVQKIPGKNTAITSKAGNRRTQAFKRNRMTPSSLLTTQSQSSSATPQENCNLGLSQDATPLQSSDIKTEPKFFSDTGVLDVENNLKEPRKREPSKNFIEGSGKSPGVMSRCFDLSITQKDQEAPSDIRREIKYNVTANTSAVGNQGEMTPRTQALSGLKSIEDVLKLKRKAGRPFKKKTLFKMAKLLAIAQEGGSNDTENCGMIEECVPKFQQVPAYHPPKSKVKKTDTRTVASNSPTSTSRKSSRTCKTTPKTVQKMQILTHTPTQPVLPVSSYLIEPILKLEDTTLISPLSVIPLCSADISPQQESHRGGKPLKKNTPFYKNMTTAVPHPPIFALDSKALAEIAYTGNDKETKKDIGSKSKCKRVPRTRGVSELPCTNGFPQGDIHTQTNRDEVYSKTSAPTVPHSQKSRKRGVQHKKGTEKALVLLSDQTALPVSDCQLQVQNHSASQETPLLPSKIETESDTVYPTPRTVTKNIPKMCKARNKPLLKVEKAQVPTLDPSLVVEHMRPDEPEVDQMRQVEAVIESVIKDVHQPLEHVDQRNKNKEEASNVSASTLDSSLGMEHMRPDVPEVDHTRQMEAVMESVTEDLHKKEVSDISASAYSTFPSSDNLFEQHNHSTLSQSPLLTLEIKTESGRIKNALPKKSKICMKEKHTSKSLLKNHKKASMPTSGPSSDTVHAPSKRVKKNSTTCQERKIPSQKVEKAQVSTLDINYSGEKHRSPEIPQMDEMRHVEAFIDAVIEDLHKPLKPKDQQKKLKEETDNVAPLEPTTFPALDNLLEQHNHSKLPQSYFLSSRKTKSGLKHTVPKTATKNKSKACFKGKLSKTDKKAAVLTSDPSIGGEDGYLEMPPHFNQAEKGGKSDGKNNNDVVKHEISMTDYHLETAAHKPHQRKGPRKKLKKEDCSVSKPDQVESTISDSQLKQHVSLLASETKTESGMEHIIPEMATTNKSKSSRKRDLPLKAPPANAKRAAMLTSNPSLGAEDGCLEMPPNLIHAKQGGKCDGKSNNNVVKHKKETVTSVMEKHMETERKPRMGSKKNLKEEDSNVFISEQSATLTSDKHPNQVSSLASEIKSESNSGCVTPTQKKYISKACKKMKITPTPPSSKLSLGMEYGYSEMATNFTHVDQVQNILDTYKISKVRKKITGSSCPKSNRRNSRLPYTSNSHITTESMQDQVILSVASDLTNNPTHITDDNMSLKLLSAFVKEELIEEEKSPENRGKEDGKGKKGKILKIDDVNPQSKHSQSQVKDGNALTDDKLILQVPIDEAGGSMSIAIDTISTVIPKRKKGGCFSKRLQKMSSTTNVPSEQQCSNMSPEKTSLCVSNISEIQRKRKVDTRSTDFVNADIKVLNPKDDLSDSSVLVDSSLLENQRMKNKGKKKSKTITEEPTVATSVVKEMVGQDFQTTITALKNKQGRPFKKRTLRMAKRLSCGEQKSNTSGELSVNKTQSCKSKGTSKGGKKHNLNPASSTLIRHTKASKAMKIEDIALKQEQDDIWEIVDVSSNIFSSQTVTISPSISGQEFEISSETMFSVDAGPIQGIQPIESTQLTPHLTKLPHKVTGVKKRRRRNKTGWATKVKSKRPLSKVNSGDRLDVLIQSTIDKTGLNTSLCNSLMENYTLESVEQEECRAQEVKAVTNDYNVVNVREINCGDQLLTARAKLQHSSVLQQNFKTRKPMSCHFCGRSFRHISAYTIHKRIHTGEKPYRCQKCGKSFAQLSKLNSHSNIHKQHGLMQCPCCVTQSPNKDDLIDHLKIHMKGTKRFSLINKTRRAREIQIQSCTDYIDSPVSLNGRKTLRCSTCFKYFFSKATLKMHLQTHSGVSRFTCKVCGKMFSKFLSFNAHEKTHWPVKPYACSVCGKGFALLRELKTHSHMHSGEMPFFCNQCGQAFSVFSSLRTHQVSKVCFEARYEGDGNKVDIEGFLVEQRTDGQINTPMYFKCQICKQLNRHWCQYILHLQTHTNNRPNLCEVCGQRYDQVTELCVHCKVCCKSSGEERACISSLSQVWYEPQSLQNQTPEPEIDSLYNDSQEMLSLDDQHPQCKEPEPLPPPETMEEYSSDVLPQNPKSACQTPDPRPHPSPSNSMCASPALSSPSVMRCNSVRVVQQPAGVRSCLQTHAPCDRYSCGQCGKSFNQWNKLWLHQGLHREKRCSFSCNQCNLEFRFFGSYREHMQEHAAQRPYACPLCPKTYVIEEDLKTHLCENHQPRESLKCDTCGKEFTGFRNLEKHRLLHRGASSHYCLPCMLPFPSNQALQNHLKAHEARPVIPLPKGPLEPLLFPYRCGKCNARFTTTDLLQAHQVCHLIGGKKAYSSSSANYVSAFLTSKLSNKPRQRVTLLSPQTIPIPPSKKRNMYRYPNPDRLYVVPKISSQPSVIISDTEEEPQELLNISLSSVYDTPCNTVSLEHEGQIIPSNDCCEASNSDLPQPSYPSSCVLTDEPTQCAPKPQTDTTHMPTDEPPSPCPLDKGPQNVPAQIRDKSKGDHDAFFRASTFVIPRGKKWGYDAFECADCWVTFSDVSELHEHYIHHARGVK
ncbi:uncharacterized protein LOC118946457 [Oncorhynchus mykiss]|uniref:C2H2-type domain-containing protein n=1 Tax=Oncorhynchus mykiss TaxID=8022 RepID=A0A8K9WPK7_ONCMY|nr:uncharacterized protein LOC118946457 [Oncorhynchus mykiss]XP_036826778.1 uncharacterized protein LOC118946457 [Oncorhynchus mykiss]